MEQYIQKSAVQAEILKCYTNSLEKARLCSDTRLKSLTQYWEGKANAYRHMLDYLDDIEVINNK